MVYNPAIFIALLKATSGLSKPVASFISVNNSAPDPVSTSLAIVSTSLPTRHTPLDGRSMQEDSCYVEPYATSPIIETFGPFDQDTATIMRYRRQQSVNMGSWFVNENWMTPSLFRGASGMKLSELDIASGWGSVDCARSVLERHWGTFITRSDFQYLASIGINTVRLPIGYWNLGPYYCQDTPFDAVSEVYRNSWASVIRAINMAAEVGIGVLVDLHGAVGSQNGQPHSGISDGATNLFKSPLNVNKTLDVLEYLVQQLVYVTNVVGIEVLNEPKNVPELIDFYSQAITVMRQSSPGASQLPIYVHNGFDPQRFDDFVASREDFVVQDHHSYFVFTTSDDAKPASQHTGDIQGSISATLDNASKKQHGNLVIDEWSCALTPNSIANESDPFQARKDFCTGQMDVYSNTTAGWSFWSYFKEGCDGDAGWCFKAAVGTSLPSTFFSYQDRPTDDSKLQTVRNTIEGTAPPSASDVLAKFPQAATAPSSLSGRQHALPSNCLPRTHDLYHRFEAIHSRQRRQDSSNQTAVQRSILQGYYDGLSTGNMFAVKGNWSKLGFVHQYASYLVATLGPSVVTPGTEDDYHRAFVKGLRDGEEIIKSALQHS